MSFVKTSTVHAIAQSLEVSSVNEEAAKALAPDVEYRLREIVQEAQKFMRHSKRRMLTTDDVNQALRLKNVQPLYGFSGKDPARFARAAGHQDLLYLHDPELTFEQAIDQPLPKVPADVGVIPHWLAIDGVQPAIPENAAIQPRAAKRPRLDPAAAARTKSAAAFKAADAGQAGQAAAGPTAEQAVAAAASAEGQEASLVRAPVKHVLSQELQLYFDRVAHLLRAKAEPVPATAASSEGQGQLQKASQLQQQRAVLASLAVDPGLHPLTPYFSQLIAEEGRKSLKSLPTMKLLLQALRSLVTNEAVQLEPYLHQIMPFILTCMVGKRLGASGLEDHWAVREEAARLAALVCSKYGQPYYQIQPRITQALNTAFQQTGNPLTTHYGAIVGLTALGHQAVRNALYPNLAPYLSLLQQQMHQSSNEMKRFEAYKCFGALLQAAGLAIRDRIKSRLFPAKAGKEDAPAFVPEQEESAGADQHSDAKDLNAENQTAQGGTEQPGVANVQHRAHGASEAMHIDSALDSGQRSAEQTTQNAQTQQSGGPKQTHAARPTAIKVGAKLLKLRRTQMSPEFTDSDQLQKTLSNAWSETCDIGQQLAVLYELFGDALFTHVPFLPCMAASV